MSNICYTKYIIEGPEAERKTLADFFEEAWLRAEHAGSRLPQIPLRNLLLAVGIKETAIALHGNLIGNIVSRDDAIFFETETEWGACNDVWDAILRRIAPNCRYYYCEERFYSSVFTTNDVWKKYFPGDFAVTARIARGKRSCWQDAFGKKEYLRRYDECDLYFSVWEAPVLCKLLRQWLHLERAHVDELIPRFEHACHDRVHIDIIDRLAPSLHTGGTMGFGGGWNGWRAKPLPSAKLTNNMAAAQRRARRCNADAIRKYHA